MVEGVDKEKIRAGKSLITLVFFFIVLFVFVFFVFFGAWSSVAVEPYDVSARVIVVMVILGVFFVLMLRLTKASEGTEDEED